MGWIWLLCGGLAEIGFTTALRYVNGFKHVPWTAAFFLFVFLSLFFLNWATRTIPVGTAYAVWGAIGALGTVSVGIAFFNESANPIRLALLAGIVLCVIGLKLVEGNPA